MKSELKYRHGIDVSRGFTIVELLIVIVVIAILAAITIVAFNGVQQRAKVAAKVSTVQQATKLVQLYKTEQGDYPTNQGSAAFFCLTTDNACTSYNGAEAITDNTTLMSDLRGYGTPPSQAGDPIVDDGRYGVSYSYHAPRTLSSVPNPVVIMFYLEGINQTCTNLIAGTVSVADSGVSNNLIPASRSSGNSGGKTRCYIMFPN